MKRLFVFIFLMSVLETQSQILGPMTINFSIVPDIKNPELFSTSLLSSASVFSGVINTLQFKKIKKKADAGFLLFPGLIQLSAGAFFIQQNNASKTIDIALGLGSTLICVGRMMYKPKVGKSALSVAPYYLPLRNRCVGGFCLKLKL